MNEEDFLAVPFCFLVFDKCMGEVQLLSEYGTELMYCKQLAENLSTVLGN
jgi:hypothetical protein